MGQKSGEEKHTLIAAEMPQHNHVEVATSQTADQSTPESNVLAKTTDNIYGDKTRGTLNTNSILNAGDGQAHENMQPYLAVRFIVALQGLFPSRN